MFYEIFEKKCREKGISPTATLKKLKISTSKLTAWKNGSMPNSEFLIPISEFLGVSIDYLLTGWQVVAIPFLFFILSKTDCLSSIQVCLR